MAIDLSTCSIEDLQNELNKRNRHTNIINKVVNNPLKCQE